MKLSEGPSEGRGEFKGREGIKTKKKQKKAYQKNAEIGLMEAQIKALIPKSL